MADPPEEAGNPLDIDGAISYKTVDLKIFPHTYSLEEPEGGDIDSSEFSLSLGQAGTALTAMKVQVPFHETNPHFLFVEQLTGGSVVGLTQGFGDFGPAWAHTCARLLAHGIKGYEWRVAKKSGSPLLYEQIKAEIQSKILPGIIRRATRAVDEIVDKAGCDPDDSGGTVCSLLIFSKFLGKLTFTVGDSQVLWVERNTDGSLCCHAITKADKTFLNPANRFLAEAEGGMVGMAPDNTSTGKDASKERWNYASKNRLVQPLPDNLALPYVYKTNEQGQPIGGGVLQVNAIGEHGLERIGVKPTPEIENLADMFESGRLHSFLLLSNSGFQKLTTGSISSVIARGEEEEVTLNAMLDVFVEEADAPEGMAVAVLKIDHLLTKAVKTPAKLLMESVSSTVKKVDPRNLFSSMQIPGDGTYTEQDVFEALESNSGRIVEDLVQQVLNSRESGEKKGKLFLGSDEIDALIGDKKRYFRPTGPGRYLYNRRWEMDAEGEPKNPPKSVCFVGEYPMIMSLVEIAAFILSEELDFTSFWFNVAFFDKTFRKGVWPIIKKDLLEKKQQSLFWKWALVNRHLFRHLPDVHRRLDRIYSGRKDEKDESISGDDDGSDDEGGGDEKDGSVSGDDDGFDDDEEGRDQFNTDGGLDVQLSQNRTQLFSRTPGTTLHGTPGSAPRTAPGLSNQRRRQGPSSDRHRSNGTLRPHGSTPGSIRGRQGVNVQSPWSFPAGRSPLGSNSNQLASQSPSIGGPHGMMSPSFEWFIARQQERDESFRQQQIDIQRQQEQRLQQQFEHQQRLEERRAQIDEENAATNRQNAEANRQNAETNRQNSDIMRTQANTNSRHADANERNAVAVESLAQILVQNQQGQAGVGPNVRSQVPPVPQASSSQSLGALNNQVPPVPSSSQSLGGLNNQVPPVRRASSSQNFRQQPLAPQPNQNDPPAEQLITSTPDFDIFESADGSRHIYKSKTSNESFQALVPRSTKSVGCKFCKSTTKWGPCQSHCPACAALGRGNKCPLHGGN